MSLWIVNIHGEIEGDYELIGKYEPTRTGKCKDCKFFDYDFIGKMDGMPLILAHEICNRWGDGCKTKEDGYCFLFEPKMDGVSE